MGNKRGLTLLYCALKILSKLYQICLSIVLQGFISKQQSAFLPGRSIHKVVMLANEILHKAKYVEESFLLLKLDTIKTFNCLGWYFIARLLARIGCGPKFINMMEAMYASAAAFVLVQGRLSPPIPLKRSLHQGCPLSPLLFLVVANALNSMLTKATNRGLIRGVPIVETGEQYTQSWPIC